MTFRYFWYTRAVRLTASMFVASMLVWGNCPVWASPAPDVVFVCHPSPPQKALHTRVHRYFVDLIKLALSKSEVNYQPQEVSVPSAPDRRSMRFLKENKYDVMWLHTNRMLERELRPVRFPLFKGLIGWRLFLITPGNEHLFVNPDMATLKSMTGLLGLHWPDVDIMEYNGFTTRTAADNGGNVQLLNMLKSSRGHYFSRSVVEIWHEQSFFNDDQIEVESNIALVYKSAFYLFVSKQNEPLALARFISLYPSKTNHLPWRWKAAWKPHCWTVRSIVCLMNTLPRICGVPT